MSPFNSHSPLKRLALNCGWKAFVVVCGWKVLLVVGCGAAGSNVDAGAFDAGPADAIRPPDISAAADAGISSGNIGASCDVTNGSGCTGQASCLALSATLGVCAIADCVLEDTSTSVKEDSCPAQAACAAVPVESGSTTEIRNFCLLRCTPDPETNACAPLGSSALACDPLSILFTGHAEVCLMAACARHEECGDGMRCHPASGVCLIEGQSEVLVGAPCTEIDACGPNQFCLPERKIDDKIRLAGGYCTVVGCKYQGPWSCPDGSECIGLGSEDQAMALCLKRCDLNSSTPECREGYDCLEVDSVGVCWLDLIP